MDLIGAAVALHRPMSPALPAHTEQGNMRPGLE